MSDDLRTELIGELDLALAALRRVIVRAIDLAPPMAPALPVSDPIKTARSLPVNDPVKTAKQWRDEELAERAGVTFNDVTVLFSPPTVMFGGKSVEVSGRHAELIAVLAKTMKLGWLARKDLTRQAWPGLAVTSCETLLSSAIAPLSERLSQIGLKLTSQPGYGVILAEADGQQ